VHRQRHGAQGEQQAHDDGIKGNDGEIARPALRAVD
jgi:hypothetical protein